MLAYQQVFKTILQKKSNYFAKKMHVRNSLFKSVNFNNIPLKIAHSMVFVENCDELYRCPLKLSMKITLTSV